MPFRARCNPASLVTRHNALVAFQKARRPVAGPLSAAVVHSAIRAPGPSRVRYASSSSFLSPFTRLFEQIKSKENNNPTSAAEAFIAGLPSAPIKDLQALYATVLLAPTPSALLSPEDILSAMQALAARAPPDPAALNLLLRICEDAPSRFGYPIETAHQNAVMLGLSNCGRVEEALSVALAMGQGQADWRVLVHAALSVGESVNNRALKMVRGAEPLSREDWIALLQNTRLCVSTAIARRDLEAYLQEMDESGVALDGAMQAEVARVYVRLGEMERAEVIVAGWDLEGGRGVVPSMWTAVADMAVAKGDPSELENAVQRMRDGGLEVPQSAISALAVARLDLLIESSSAISFRGALGALESAEQTSGGTADADTWADVINHLTQKVTALAAVDVAFELYGDSQTRGLKITPRFASSVVKPLAEIDRLEDAMRVFNDFTSTATPADLENLAGWTAWEECFPPLLSACLQASPPDYRAVLRLLGYMKSVGFELESSVLTYLLPRLMRNAPTHKAAYSAYTKVLALNPKLFDDSLFQNVFWTFLKFSTDESVFPPHDMVIAILKDMRVAGFPYTHEGVNALLRRYAVLGTSLRRQTNALILSNSDIYVSPSPSTYYTPSHLSIILPSHKPTPLDGVIYSIREVHKFLKLDPHTTPEPHLLTGLMDAYSRVGAFHEAFQVWDELVQRRAHQPRTRVQAEYSAAINVILDTCGWSYSLGAARKAWDWGRRWDLVGERKHYEAYVECLLRCGQVEEAGNVVLDEMGTGKVPVPTKDTVRLLFKFGRRERSKKRNLEAVANVMKRLEERWPEWYDELDSEGDTARQRMKEEQGHTRGRRA
ncbi:hypothetical protein IAT38_002680 [Cryptococcus sp. DSM 104549]